MREKQILVKADLTQNEFAEDSSSEETREPKAGKPSLRSSGLTNETTREKLIRLGFRENTDGYSAVIVGYNPPHKNDR